MASCETPNELTPVGVLRARVLSVVLFILGGLAFLAKDDPKLLVAFIKSGAVAQCNTGAATEWLAVGSLISLVLAGVALLVAEDKGKHMAPQGVFLAAVLVLWFSFIGWLGGVLKPDAVYSSTVLALVVGLVPMLVRGPLKNKPASEGLTPETAPPARQLMEASPAQQPTEITCVVPAGSTVHVVSSGEELTVSVRPTLPKG